MNPLASQRFLPDPAVLRGTGRYKFTARVEGDDLVVQGVRATWFGGAHDAQDDGQTASGLSTRLHPDLLGCALPMEGFHATQGSPLPRLPFLTTQIQVTRPATGQSVTVALVDLGPSAPPRAHAAIDLTVAAFRALGGSLSTGVLSVDYRILGGARHLPSATLSAARAAAVSPASAPLPRAAQAQGCPGDAAPAVAAVTTAAAPPRGTQDPAPSGAATGSGRSAPAATRA